MLRIGAVWLVHGRALDPVVAEQRQIQGERHRRLARGDSRQSPFGQGHRRHPGRRRQALLRARVRVVHAPAIKVQLHTTEGRNAIGHEQRVRAPKCSSQFRKGMLDAGAGFGVHDSDEGMRAIPQRVRRARRWERTNPNRGHLHHNPPHGRRAISRDPPARSSRHCPHHHRVPRARPGWRFPPPCPTCLWPTPRARARRRRRGTPARSSLHYLEQDLVEVRVEVPQQSAPAWPRAQQGRRLWAQAPQQARLGGGDCGHSGSLGPRSGPSQTDSSSRLMQSRRFL